MTAAVASSNRISRAIWVMVVVLSALYALAWFPGLEYHGGYRGHAYKAIHPESFPGDPYLTPEGPIRLTSYYRLARLVGDWWLDDRLTLGVYVGLVVLALIGVDRTAQLLGSHGLAERLAVIGLMAIPHGFRDNMAMLVTFADFYAGTFAGVVAIWLIYHALAGRVWWTLALLAIIWSLTMKWAWFPTVITLICLAHQRLSLNQRRWVLVGSVLGLGLLSVAYLVWWRPAGDLHARLFDHLMELEGSEANPWLDSVMGNLKYWGLIGLSLWLPVPVPDVARQMRLVALLGALLWLLGGAYLTCSPDALKVPYLVPLAFNRAVQWPQHVLYLAITVGALARMRVSSWRVRLGLAGLLLVLYATFDVRRALMAGLAWLVLMGLCVLVCRWWHVRRDGAVARQRLRVALAVPAGLAVALTTMLVCARVIARRAPALAFLARHGVIGDNPSAKWVGVDAYLREKTPITATVLAVAPYDYPWRPGLCYDGSLRVRAGRTMPLGGEWNVLFDYPRLLQVREQTEHMTTLIQAWAARDIDTVQQEMRYFHALGYALDYLVMEPQEAAWLQEYNLPYRFETAIGRFVVLKRRTDADAGAPATPYVKTARMRSSACGVRSDSLTNFADRIPHPASTEL